MFIKQKTFNKPIFEARLRYNLREDAIQEEEGRGFILKQIIRGITIPEMVRFFLENEKYRKVTRKDSIRIKEFYISFDPRDSDVLTKETLMDIARHFMHQFDPLTPAVAVPHFDKEHVHIHIIFAGIQYKTGKSNDKNNREFDNFKKAIERYQIRKYPEIKYSIVQTKERAKECVVENDREYRVKKRTGTSKKLILRKEVEQAISKSKNLNQLKENLRERSMEYYHNSESRHGIIFQGKKYRFSKLNILFNVLELIKEQDRKAYFQIERENNRN